MSKLFSMILIGGSLLMGPLPAHAGSKDGTILYRVFRDRIFDIEEIFRNSGIEPVGCNYKGPEKTVHSEQGIGYCIFENFLQASKKGAQPGELELVVNLGSSWAGKLIYEKQGIPLPNPVHLKAKWQPVQFREKLSAWEILLPPLLIHQAYQDLKELSKRYLENHIDLTFENAGRMVIAVDKVDSAEEIAAGWAVEGDVSYQEISSQDIYQARFATNWNPQNREKFKVHLESVHKNTSGPEVRP